MQKQAFVKVYKQLSKIPELKTALITKTNANDLSVQIQLQWSFRNIATSKRLLTQVDYFVKGEDVKAFPPITKHSNIIAYALEEKTLASAVVLQDENVRQLVIYHPSGRSSAIDLKELDLHGKVYDDATLSSFIWSSDGLHLAYVAEKKRPKPLSFFSQKKENDDATDGVGETNLFYDEWGEQMTGMSQSTLVVVNVQTEEVKILDFPEGICGGEILWSSDGLALYGIGYKTSPYRLGLIFCTNRDNVIFKMDTDGTYSEPFEQSGAGSISALRMSVDRKSLCFLTGDRGGPHRGSVKLCVLDIASNKMKTLIDHVSRGEVLDDGGHVFRGLTGGSTLLPSRCWSEDGRNIYLSTHNRNYYVSYVVNSESGKMARIPHDKSLMIHDIKDDWVLASSSSLTSPRRVLLAKLPKEELSHLEWHFVPISQSFEEEVVHLTLGDVDEWLVTNPVPHPVAKYSDMPIPVIYLGPTKLKDGEVKRPLIVSAHGGPHGAVTNDFAFRFAFLASAGYSVLMVNYRGSTGQGREGITSLPGHCGIADVEDVHQSTLSALERFKDVIDENQVLLSGGSHGGFLVTSLAGKYPETYKVVCALNPVIDIASLSRTSDIPDWAFVEAGLEFDEGKIADREELWTMQKASPINVIERVKAPVLLLLGTEDRRVPHQQGLYYHKQLLARGVKTKVYTYKDCHSLAKVDVEADHLLQMVLWFESHRK